MLAFADPPDRHGLVLALSVRLRWYWKWRAQKRRLGWRERSSQPRLFETAPLSLLPAVSIRDDPFAEILRASSVGDLWHLQVRARRPFSFGSSRSWVPRYYARASYDNEWRILWIGESWLARAVHRAIRKLDGDEPDLPDSPVRVVSSRAYQFTTLWIENGDTHLIAHASRPLETRLPRLEYLSGNELQERLLDHFGDRHEREGIGGDPGRLGQSMDADSGGAVDRK